MIDLLNLSTFKKPLQVRWSRKLGGFYVENQFTVECQEFDDLLAVLEEGPFHCIPYLTLCDVITTSSISYCTECTTLSDYVPRYAKQSSGQSQHERLFQSQSHHFDGARPLRSSGSDHHHIQ